MKPACCLACHFRWEERELFPQLPGRAAIELQHEHDALIAYNTTAAQIEAHAAREMKWFRVYCTPDQVAQCQLDHEHLGGKAKRGCSGGCSHSS